MHTVYYQCNQVSDAFLPLALNQPWFEDDGRQYFLVAFYNVVAILAIVYIASHYIVWQSKEGIKSLFVYKPGNKEVFKDGDGNPVLFDENDEGEGYVPQVMVPSLPHSIQACHAPFADDGPPIYGAGYEFHPYLVKP